MIIDKGFLQGIINDFANVGKVFTNERQFQFELGLEMQRRFDREKTGYKVLFEVLSLNGSITNFVTLSKEEKEKLYTDIIVDLGNDEYIAIELKYKIAQKRSAVKALQYNCKSVDYYTFSQGAYDIGCYDFWWDVNRLERLVARKIKYNFTDKKVIKGFSIIMTNDDNYQKTHVGMFKNFFLVEGKEFKGKIQWSDKAGKNCAKYPGTAKSLLEDKGIDISGTYKAEWKDYKLPSKTECYEIPSNSGSKKDDYEQYKFKYLIFEIK